MNILGKSTFGRIIHIPTDLERKLRRQARKLFPGDKRRQDRYKYPILRKTGWTPNQASMAR